MPNWVNNYLVITGEKEELQKFKAQAAGKYHFAAPQDPPSVLCFEKLVPIPFEKIKPGGIIDWQYTNWGCKWGACDAHLTEESDRELVYIFQTPNSRPAEFLKRVGKQWPNLEFHDSYIDPMTMRFVWCIEVHGEKSLTHPDNMEEALLVWHETAQAGEADAQYYLGLCYAEGRVLPKKYAEALKWWTMAAAQGHAQAAVGVAELIKELADSRK